MTWLKILKFIIKILTCGILHWEDKHPTNNVG